VATLPQPISAEDAFRRARKLVAPWLLPGMLWFGGSSPACQICLPFPTREVSKAGVRSRPFVLPIPLQILK
jgi:hypothetical protein